MVLEQLRFSVEREKNTVLSKSKIGHCWAIFLKKCGYKARRSLGMESGIVPSYWTVEACANTCPWTGPKTLPSSNDVLTEHRNLTGLTLQTSVLINWKNYTRNLCENTSFLIPGKKKILVYCQNIKTDVAPLVLLLKYLQAWSILLLFNEKKQFIVTYPPQDLIFFEISTKLVSK